MQYKDELERQGMRMAMVGMIYVGGPFMLITLIAWCYKLGIIALPY